MGLEYRGTNKLYNAILEKTRAVENIDANFGKNRYKLLENSKEVVHNNILDPQDAEKLLKDLGIEFDSIEDYGGGKVYTKVDKIVAEYNPSSLNITVYQDLEGTLDQPKDQVKESSAFELGPDLKGKMLRAISEGDVLELSNLLRSNFGLNFSNAMYVNDFVKRGGMQLEDAIQRELDVNSRYKPSAVDQKIDSSGPSVVGRGTPNLIGEKVSVLKERNPSIRLYVDGKYKHSTKMYPTAEIAKKRYCEKFKLDPSTVEAKIDTSEPITLSRGEYGVREDFTSSTQEEYTVLARGISDKDVADQVAKEKEGRVSDDDKETGKFMIVKAKEGKSRIKEFAKKKKEEGGDFYTDYEEIMNIKGYVDGDSFDWKHDVDSLQKWCSKMRKKGCEIYQYGSGDDQYALAAIKKELTSEECEKYNLSYFDESDVESYEDEDYMDEAIKYTKDGKLDISKPLERALIDIINGVDDEPKKIRDISTRFNLSVGRVKLLLGKLSVILANNESKLKEATDKNGKSINIGNVVKVVLSDSEYQGPVTKIKGDVVSIRTYGTGALSKFYKDEQFYDTQCEVVESKVKEAKLICKKCGKPIKEDTDGDDRYCQGHGIGEKISEAMNEDADIPEEILDIMWDDLSKGLSFKDIVNHILDWPKGRRWFETKYQGNEFDLRQELEGIYEDERADDSNESKVNEFSNQKDPELVKAMRWLSREWGTIVPIPRDDSEYVGVSYDEPDEILFLSRDEIVDMGEYGLGEGVGKNMKEFIKQSRRKQIKEAIGKGEQVFISKSSIKGTPKKGELTTYRGRKAKYIEPDEYPVGKDGWWVKIMEDCIFKPGERYKFDDGEEVEVDNVDGNTIHLTTSQGEEASMQYAEMDHMLHAGQLKKISEDKKKDEEWADARTHEEAVKQIVKDSWKELFVDSKFKNDTQPTRDEVMSEIEFQSKHGLDHRPDASAVRYDAYKKVMKKVKNIQKKLDAESEETPEEEDEEAKKQFEAKKWMKKAFPKNKGGLHKALDVPEGEKIPAGKLSKALQSKDPHVKKMAQAAKNAQKESIFKLAEKMLIVKYLSEKKNLSEKQKTFVDKVLKIELTDETRAKVKEKTLSLIKRK